MYDAVATLMGNPRVSYDEYGNEILTYSEYDVFVTPRGVYQAEFYNAAQAGLHPSITFELNNKIDYHGERLIRYKGVLYNVVRVDWTGQKDKLALISEERVKNG